MSERHSLGALVASGILDLGDGYRTKKSELSEQGYQIIRVADIRENRIFMDSPDFVSDMFSRQIGNKVARAGDVILTTKGTVGRVAVVPEGVGRAVYSPQVCWFRILDPTQLSGRYLSYWLRADEFLAQSSYMQGNSDMAPYISLTDLKRATLTLPSLAEQQAIAEVLGALDDKIAANTELAATADELASRTFRSLPKTGRVALSSTAEFINGKAFTKGASGTGRIVVRIAELNSGPSASTVYSDAIVDNKYVAQRGDILFAWSGSLTLHRWFRDESIVNQHIFKVVPVGGNAPWLVYEVLRAKLEDFRRIAADKATTMGHIQRRHLDEEVSLPSDQDIVRANPTMTALWDIGLTAQTENLTLAAIRDALLPQLMSGKLRVRDAEKLTEEIGA